jgi:hypothetical protein
MVRPEVLIRDSVYGHRQEATCFGVAPRQGEKVWTDSLKFPSRSSYQFL